MDSTVPQLSHCPAGCGAVTVWEGTAHSCKVNQFNCMLELKVDVDLCNHPEAKCLHMLCAVSHVLGAACVSKE